ncbi:hypothetical protein EUGRSUZ_F00135 [Eucalyptus grandis]|uniref:Uncharacterized protein n=2 Tax=Eucalyptus grandis TaxID=71139 RepID=A0ACC3KCQ8_EUCGR|nr:hypothetical protein EUGRSUZ_F00135 [Eucalyptus grandis]
MCEFLPFLRWMRPKRMEEKLMALQKKRDEFMQSLLMRAGPVGAMSHRRRADGGKKKTLIQVLLSLQETEPEYYKDEVIKSLMVVSLFTFRLLVFFS